MVKKTVSWTIINWYVDGRLNIEEINDFSLKYIEEVEVKDCGGTRRHKRPFYILYRTERKKKPYSIRFGYYIRKMYTNAKPFECDFHTVMRLWDGNYYVKYWNHVFGVDEHKLDNKVIISNSLSKLRKMQKIMNLLNDKNYV